MIDFVPEIYISENGNGSQPAKFSAIMLEFAEPLLEIVRAEGPSIEALRSSMKLATLCWNAPLGAVRGDECLQRELDDLLKSTEPALQAALRTMVGWRMTRYGRVRVPVFAEIEGTSVEDARCTAYAVTSSEELEELARDMPAPIASMPLGRFADAFPELAELEQMTWTVDAESDDRLPQGSYLLEERYCAEADCDCRRVQLWVYALKPRRVVATIGYAFEPPPPRFAAFEKQVELDLLNPQSELSDAALARFEGELAADADCRARLIRHYEAWKAVVDDPAHPLHATFGVRHGAPFERPVYPRRAEPVRRDRKVGANELCPCGSRRKYKRCCRSAPRAAPTSPSPTTRMP
jgi:hypothetical protein